MTKNKVGMYTFTLLAISSQLGWSKSAPSSWDEAIQAGQQLGKDIAKKQAEKQANQNKERELLRNLLLKHNAGKDVTEAEAIVFHAVVRLRLDQIKSKIEEKYGGPKNEDYRRYLKGVQENINPNNGDFTITAKIHEIHVDTLNYLTKDEIDVWQDVTFDVVYRGNVLKPEEPVTVTTENQKSGPWQPSHKP